MYIVVDCADITVAGYPLISARSCVPFFFGRRGRKTFCHPTVVNIGRFVCLSERFVGGEQYIVGELAGNALPVLYKGYEVAIRGRLEYRIITYLE